MISAEMWQFEGQPFMKTYDQILAEGYYGFLYLIENKLTGQKYVGVKSFHTLSKMQSRRKFNIEGRHSMDWWNYWSSSKYLQDDIKRTGYQHFTRTILGFYKTRKKLYYAEVEMMVKNDVLRAKGPDGKYLWYNRNIAGKFFRKDFEEV